MFLNCYNERKGEEVMQYQIICLKNKSFWNRILLFIAFFVLAVYCISLVMPDVKKDVSKDGSLYQQIEQQIDSDNQSSQNEEQV